MKTVKKIVLAACLLCIGNGVYAQQIDPLQRAMLNTYENLLKENPKDWQTYFERGSMYYQMGLYDQALNDLAKAIQYTPAKETNYITQTFATLSDVNVKLQNYESALQAINKALELQPKSYINLYKKGNILLDMNRNDEALSVFRSLQNLKSRSQEAYYGMARAMIQKEDYSEVDDLIKEIENADPSNYATYCRIGDLYADMNKYEEAAANYLSAFALTNNSQRPINSLRDIAETHFDAFERAINYALSRTSNKLPLYYILGNFAYDNGKYDVANEALSSLLDLPTGKDAYVMATLSRTKTALLKLDEAKANALSSINLSPSAEGYLALSAAELAQGNVSASLTAAEKGIQLAPNSEAAQMALAEAQIASGKGTDAVSTLNDIIMSNPDNIRALILRGYVNEQMLKNPNNAKTDFSRAASSDVKAFPQVVYRAIGKYKSGKLLDAQELIDNALKRDSSAEALYETAVYYAKIGNVAKGKELLQQAKAAGYQNRYNLDNNSSILSISSLR